MLRIIDKSLDDDSRVTLLVEGRIVDEGLAVLERECDRHLKAGAPLSLDLSRVTYLGPGGILLLRRLAQEGVRLVRLQRLLQEML